MANIAEGFERGSNRQFVQYLLQARGSASEVRSLLYIARDLDLIGEVEFENAAEQTTLVARLLSGFIRYLRQSAT
jgi:four helix bundle protein